MEPDTKVFESKGFESNVFESKEKRTKGRPKKILPTCNICDEKINQTNHSIVCCPFCEFEACRTCCQTFLCTIEDPHCMNTSCCKRWTQKFLSESMTQTFLTTTYKEHREKFLFDKEMAMMPATQIVIEHLRYQESLKKELHDIQLSIHYLTRRRDKLRHMIYINAPPPREDDPEYDENNDNTLKQGSERRAFVRRCADSSCRGFLSSAWKCGICFQRTCHKCHVLKVEGQDHACDPDHVETVKLLANDSKTCPKCGVYIYKTEGCNQMWCTQCHIAFDWVTGRVQTKVHNPHYYEWIRQQNISGMDRDPMDFQCGRELHQGMLRYELIHPSKPYVNQFLRILQVSMHVQDTVVPRYRVDPEVCCERLRIQYLRNEISEEHFRIYVQRMYKKNEKKREISDVLAVYIHSVTDILFRFVDRAEYYYNHGNESNESNELNKSIQWIESNDSKELNKSIQWIQSNDSIESNKSNDSNESHELTEIIKEVERLIQYCNECFLDIGKMYQGQAIQFQWPIPNNHFMFLTTIK